MKVSLVVPVYKGERGLPVLAGHLLVMLDRLAGRYELIPVNDGSRDGSWTAIEKLAADHPCIRGIDLMRNYGQQHPPEELPRMLDKLGEGYDVVCGTPASRPSGPVRALASRATKLVLQSVMSVDIAGSVSAFRAFRRDVRDAFADYRSCYVSIDVLLAWAAASRPAQ